MTGDKSLNQSELTITSGKYPFYHHQTVDGFWFKPSELYLSRVSVIGELSDSLHLISRTIYCTCNWMRNLPFHTLLHPLQGSIRRHLVWMATLDSAPNEKDFNLRDIPGIGIRESGDVTLHLCGARLVINTGRRVIFEGHGAIEAEDFVFTINLLAMARGRMGDDVYTAQLASLCFVRSALRWYISLDSDVKRSWELLQKALMDRWKESEGDLVQRPLW